MIINGEEVSMDEFLEKNPVARQLIAHGEMTERLYLKLEEHLPCPPLSDEMLARMNEAMGFRGDRAKDRDYRPYCGSNDCRRMPRMFRVKEGFRCWACQRVWDLRTDEEKLKDPHG